MLEGGILHDIIMEEKQNGYSDLEIDDWNQVYEELKQELNQAIA